MDGAPVVRSWPLCEAPVTAPVLQAVSPRDLSGAQDRGEGAGDHLLRDWVPEWVWESLW